MKSCLRSLLLASFYIYLLFYILFDKTGVKSSATQKMTFFSVISIEEMLESIKGHCHDLHGGNLKSGLYNLPSCVLPPFPLVSLMDLLAEAVG